LRRERPAPPAPTAPRSRVARGESALAGAAAAQRRGQRGRAPASGGPEQEADRDSLARGLEERDFQPLPVVHAKHQEAAGHERTADVVSGANKAATAPACVQSQSCRKEVAACVVGEDRGRQLLLLIASFVL